VWPRRKRNEKKRIQEIEDRRENAVEVGGAPWSPLAPPKAGKLRLRVEAEDRRKKTE
jgi:hypothetical protein